MMAEEEIDPAEVGRKRAKAVHRQILRDLPFIEAGAAIEVVIQQLVALLISKRLLSKKEAYDAFALAADEIQLLPDSGAGVQIVARLCCSIIDIPDAPPGSDNSNK